MAHLFALGHGCSGRGERIRRRRRRKRKKRPQKAPMDHWPLVNHNNGIFWVDICGDCEEEERWGESHWRHSLRQACKWRDEWDEWSKSCPTHEARKKKRKEKERRERKRQEKSALCEQMKYEAAVAGVLFAWYKCNLNYCLHQWLRLYWEAKVKEAMSLSREKSFSCFHCIVFDSFTRSLSHSLSLILAQSLNFSPNHWQVHNSINLS